MHPRILTPQRGWQVRTFKINSIKQHNPIIFKDLLCIEKKLTELIDYAVDSNFKGSVSRVEIIETGG